MDRQPPLCARSSPPRALVVGAHGRIGRWVVPALRARGWSVRALVRRADPVPGAAEVRTAELGRDPFPSRALDGVDAVVSCLGASLHLADWRARRGYDRVDVDAHRALLAASVEAGVAHMAYVAAFGPERLPENAYVRAHEDVVSALRAAPFHSLVVRPTGLFWVFRELLITSRRFGPAVVGDGRSRTNPVHEGDVAQALAEALTTDLETLEIGGPQIFTREELVRLPLEWSGIPVQRVRHLSAGWMRSVARGLTPVHPRMAQLLDFGTLASTHDLVAPNLGERTLRDYVTTSEEREP